MHHHTQSFGSYQGVEYKEVFVYAGETTWSFSDLGARINRWELEGQPLVLGFEDAEAAFRGRGYYYGATVGRVAGRISQGRFDLAGESYQLPLNNGVHHIHGGPQAFDLRRWDLVIDDSQEGVISLVFTLQDPAGANGYPGDMEVQVTHSLSADGAWTVDYQAQTSQETLFNPTNHVYFNLTGHPSQTIQDHVFYLEAEAYVPLNPDVTPLGTIESVAGTVFDLREGRSFGEILASGDPQIQALQGLDHPFVLQSGPGHQGVVKEPRSGRVLTLETDRPAVVIYTSQAIEAGTRIWGEDLVPYGGFTLETQALPDAINQPGFGDIVLRPGEVFSSQTRYQITHAKE